MTGGPPWTVEREQRLPNGRVELLVRVAGGREFRMRLTAVAAVSANRATLIEQRIEALRPQPSQYAI